MEKISTWEIYIYIPVNGLSSSTDPFLETKGSH